MKPRAGAGSTVLYGCILYESWASYWNGPGIYAYSAYDANNVALVQGDINVYGGATYGNGVYYAQYFEENGSQLTFPVSLTLYNVNEAWAKQKTYTGWWTTEIARDLTWDPTQKVLYGIFSDDEYKEFNRFGYITFDEPQETAYKANHLSALPERMLAIAADNKGVIYAFGASNKLYTIDKATGEATLVGETGVEGVGKAPWLQSACFDEATGHLFWHTQEYAYDDYFEDYDFMWRTYDKESARRLEQGCREPLLGRARLCRHARTERHRTL